MHFGTLIREMWGQWQTQQGSLASPQPPPRPNPSIIARRNEQRRYPRLSFAATVALESRETKWTGTIVNVSLGGCWIRTDAALPVGELIRIRLCDPLWPSLTLEAVVLRSRPTDLCLRLTVTGQEALMPVLFAHRHGFRAREWLHGTSYLNAAPTTAYIVGLPLRLAPTGLHAHLAMHTSITSVSITRVPEGPIATVHVPYAGAVDDLIRNLHGRPLLGGIVLVVRGQSRAGYMLRMVLQATAEGRFAPSQT